MIRRYLPRSIEELIHWYERYVSPFALIAGFLIDNFFLLDRVDVLFGNLVLLSYLSIAALGILLINAIESGRLTNRLALALAPFIPVVVQFAFGGLFSGYLSLYMRSAAVGVSWIFVIAIAALLIGNERFRKRYVRFTFQVSVYFIALFAYLIFAIPVALDRIGPWMFLAAGGVSLIVMSLLLAAVSKAAPAVFQAERRTIIRSIAVIFVVFNTLYFTNAIPPLPLSLKDAGIYHGVTKVGAGYEIAAEPRAWYEWYRSYHATYHQYAGEVAYAYSAVFAPTGLATSIVHEWQRYDEERGWTTEAALEFPISGGADRGYRGYSIKSVTPGRWRVNVRTEYGQLLGRVGVRVVPADTPPPLEILVR